MTLADFLAHIRRYLTVGALCAIVYNLIMIGCDFAGMHYLPATLLSVAVVGPLGYFLHCRFTFRKEHSLEGFLRFMAGIALAYPLLLALMMLFCSGLGLSVPIASLLATGVLVVFNYLLARWAIVRGRTGQPPFQLLGASRRFWRTGRAVPGDTGRTTSAGLLLTTEVMVAEAPKDAEHVDGGAPGGTDA